MTCLETSDKSASQRSKRRVRDAALEQPGGGSCIHHHTGRMDSDGSSLSRKISLRSSGYIDDLEGFLGLVSATRLSAAILF